MLRGNWRRAAALHCGGMKRDPALIPLSHHHQHALGLTVLISRGLAADDSDEKAEELREMALKAWDAELRGHFQLEEEILFPAVREKLPAPGIVEELLGEHRELSRLFTALGDATAGERRGLLQTLGPLLARHIRLEERSLFQQVQEVLSAGEMSALGKRIQDRAAIVCPTQ